jgi:hypothetical protein
LRLTTKGQWIDIPGMAVEISPLAENSVFRMTSHIFIRSHTTSFGGIKFQYQVEGGTWEDLPFIGNSPDSRTAAAFVFERSTHSYDFNFDHQFDYDVTKKITYKAQIYINTGDSRVCINYNDEDPNSANYFVGASHLTIAEVMAMVGTPGQPVEGFEYYLVKKV